MAGALEVGEPMIVAGFDVVGLGARCSMTDEAEPTGRVTPENGGAALSPVGGEASLPVAALPAAHFFRLPLPLEAMALEILAALVLLMPLALRAS
jgi:hypothetical protein